MYMSARAFMWKLTIPEALKCVSKRVRFLSRDALPYRQAKVQGNPSMSNVCVLDYAALGETVAEDLVHGVGWRHRSGQTPVRATRAGRS